MVHSVTARLVTEQTVRATSVPAASVPTSLRNATTNVMAVLARVLLTKVINIARAVSAVTTEEPRLL